MSGEITSIETVRKISRLEHENKRLKEELEVARKIIDSYYREEKYDVNKYLEKAKEQRELSDNAKRFVQDIVDGKIWLIMQ